MDYDKAILTLQRWRNVAKFHDVDEVPAFDEIIDYLKREKFRAGMEGVGFTFGPSDYPAEPAKPWPDKISQTTVELAALAKDDAAKPKMPPADPRTWEEHSCDAMMEAMKAKSPTAQPADGIAGGMGKMPASDPLTWDNQPGDMANKMFNVRRSKDVRLPIPRIKISCFKKSPRNEPVAFYNVTDGRPVDPTQLLDQLLTTVNTLVVHMNQCDNDIDQVARNLSNHVRGI